MNLEGWQATVSEIRYSPGVVAPAHRHPGFVIGYVLQGQYRFAVNDDSPAILSAGDTFFESPGDVHSVSANASQSEECVLLAIIFTPKGESVTMPA